MKENPVYKNSTKTKNSTYSVVNKYSLLISLTLLLNTSCSEKQIQNDNLFPQDEKRVSNTQKAKDIKFDNICFSPNPYNKRASKNYNKNCTVSQYFKEIGDVLKKDFGVFIDYIKKN